MNSLQCVYSAGLTKNQQSLIYGCTILFQNAIWKHSNEVNFLCKTVNVSTIIAILRSKITKLLQIKQHQLEEYIYRAQWSNIENEIKNYVTA